MNRPQLTAGPWIVVALLVATAVAHAVLVVRLVGPDPGLAAVDGLIALAALAAAATVVLRPGGAALLGAAAVGGFAVAAFVLPGLLASVRGVGLTGWLDPWAVAGLLIDATIVRIAVVALRRAESGTR